MRSFLIPNNALINDENTKLRIPWFDEYLDAYNKIYHKDTSLTTGQSCHNEIKCVQFS